MSDAQNRSTDASTYLPTMQNTIAKPASFHGLSLFHGFPVTATVLPADANTGIVFRRTDLSNAPDIPARTQLIRPVPRRTVIGHDDTVIVETIEHIMAALAGLNIDNALVELDAPEVPSYDGSCIHFCDGLLDAGIVQQSAPAITHRIRSTVTLPANQQATGDEAQVAAAPNTIQIQPGLPSIYQVAYHLNYGAGSPLTQQSATSEITPDVFYTEIAKARTFVLESEINALKSMGYGQHLTPQDLVVVTESGILDNQLHWDNEAARHKILDCVGDFALSGCRVTGSFQAHQSGHKLNHEVAGRIAAEFDSAAAKQSAA
ncbi:MAG: UDP-3-O-acyl-N-acetylglucosamine deacetylase [Fuerstiella sp.]